MENYALSLKAVPFESDTFLLSNSGATLGVPKRLKIGSCVNDGVLAFLDLKEELVTIEFLYYFFATETSRLRDEMNQGATQPNLNTGLVKGLPVPLPTIEEQGKIVKFVESSTSKTEVAMGQARQSIQKLREYKATLIDSAVTGKIKVPEAYFTS